MIVYHQNNIAAFAGNHVYYFLPGQIIVTRMSVTSAAAAAVLAAQMRNSFRMVFGRVLGRVN